MDVQEALTALDEVAICIEAEVGSYYGWQCTIRDATDTIRAALLATPAPTLPIADRERGDVLADQDVDTAALTRALASDALDATLGGA